jgi:hypothetical protein
VDLGHAVAPRLNRRQKIDVGVDAAVPVAVLVLAGEGPPLGEPDAEDGHARGDHREQASQRRDRERTPGPVTVARQPPHPGPLPSQAT